MGRVPGGRRGSRGAQKNGFRTPDPESVRNPRNPWSVTLESDVQETRCPPNVTEAFRRSASWGSAPPDRTRAEYRLETAPALEDGPRVRAANLGGSGCAERLPCARPVARGRWKAWPGRPQVSHYECGEAAVRRCGRPPPSRQAISSSSRSSAMSNFSGVSYLPD